MDWVVAIAVGMSVFWAVMAVDARLTLYHKKGPGHWFQQHWAWQAFRNLRWIFHKKPDEQKISVRPVIEREKAKHG